MVEDEKCIVGSSDPYPAGIESRNWRAWKACRAVMLQGAEPVSQHNAIDANLVEALRLVQCMLEDHRERNYGDAEKWIRHINTHMSDYTESHGDDAYSILHDLLAAAAPQQEEPNRIQEERVKIQEEMAMGARLTNHRFKP